MQVITHRRILGFAVRLKGPEQSCIAENFEIYCNKISDDMSVIFFPKLYRNVGVHFLVTFPFFIFGKKDMLTEIFWDSIKLDFFSHVTLSWKKDHKTTIIFSLIIWIILSYLLSFLFSVSFFFKLVFPTFLGPLC